MAAETIVILGAGQAGLQLAISLRAAGHNGPITLVGEERHLPYQRPPLSKAYLLGKLASEQLSLRPAAFLAEHRIGFLEGNAAVAIDRNAQEVHLRSGLRLQYDQLVLALGSRPMKLSVPGSDLPGVHYLRTLADANGLKCYFSGIRRAVVVGGGFIGLEFLSVAREMGLACTLVEIGSGLLGRALSSTMAGFIRTFHEANGVSFRFSESVVAFEADSSGRMSGAVGDGGKAIEADLALIGIGAQPNTELAENAKLVVDGGIVVNSFLFTSDPNISAIGDCAIAPNRFAGGLVRLESVQNAVDQARCLAGRLTGSAQPYDAVPWFWSDQGALRLQIVGLARSHDRSVTRGDPASGRFSVFLYRGERLLCIESVNRPQDHMAGRKLLSAGLSPDPDLVADESFDLKSLLRELASPSGAIAPTGETTVTGVASNPTMGAATI